MSDIKDLASKKLAEALGFPSDDITANENGTLLMLNASTRISRLKSENVKMREALEFYADLNNYFITSVHSNINQSLPINIDKGDIARKFLKELKHE